MRELLASDPAFSSLSHRFEELFDPTRYIGRAPDQVLEFVEAEVDPALERHRGLGVVEADVRV